jgi:hypothetical protein
VIDLREIAIMIMISRCVESPRRAVHRCRVRMRYES